VANVLSAEKRIDVLACLVKGSGIRQTEDKTGVHRDTIGRFGFAIGVGCQRIHDALVRDLDCPLVDMDEQHSWTTKRQVHINPERDDTASMGERWTWAAICRTSKLIIAWTVGKRDAEGAEALVGDVRARLSVMPQITTDGCPLYVEPIGRHFGYGVDYAQTVKRYTRGGGDKPGVAEKFSHAKGVDFIEKRVIFGAPDLGKATTYAIERSNLTNRTWNARLNRRTLCFSKRTDRHDAAIALGYVYRSLCHIPRNMRETPAMAANITDHVWSLADLMEAALSAPEVARPATKPLGFRPPVTTARELPEGRGFLRVVPSGGAPAATPPAPAPITPPPAAPAAAAPAQSSADPSGQLDLLAWRPRPPVKPLPPKGAQLELF
jgi:IS1 family transposase